MQGRYLRELGVVPDFLEVDVEFAVLELHGHPGMAEDLLDSDAGVFGVEDPQDQLHQPAAELLLVEQRVVDLPSLDVCDDLLDGVSSNRRLSGRQHEQNDAEGPYVAALIVAALEDLGRDVVGSADQGVLALLLHQLLPQIFVPLEGQSEVDEHEVQGLVVDQQEVLGLEVAVHNLVLVAVVDDADHLREERPSVGLREVALPLQPAEQLAALAETA